MFRDRKEELARLEEELLEEEIPEIEEEEEEEEFFEEPSGDTSAYHNFANNYGNVHAYNSDTTDVDLEEFSQEVQEPAQPRQTGLLLVAMLLLFGIFCVLGWWFLRYRGIIG